MLEVRRHVDEMAQVCGVLRFKNQHHLVGLLSSAYLTFEDPDLGIPSIGDAHYEIVTMVVHAPISDVEKLRSLGDDDSRAIRDAMREVWPADTGGGTIIRDVVYRVAPESLHSMPLTLSNSPTGWPKVDRGVDKLRAQLGVASTVEDHQQIGHLSREVLISLAQAVFDRRYHSSVSDDGRDIGDADVKRMLEQYLKKELPGRGNKEVRGCVRGAYDLAAMVLHRRTATYRDAALCVQAVFSLVGMVEIIAGRRDYPDAGSSQQAV